MSAAAESKCQCTNKVEGPVAFFWMICLALNSMTQPAGRVCELPTKHRFILRSSPVICAFDAIGVVILLVAHMLSHREGPSQAARRIARARFRDVENDAEEESLSSLERNVPFRFVLFVFGVLPQTIKIFASRGIPWLQIWGGMYVGSWTILEVLFWLNAAHKTKAASETASTHLKWKHLRASWAVCAIMAHAAVLGSSMIWDDFNRLARLGLFCVQVLVPARFWLMNFYRNQNPEDTGQMDVPIGALFIIFASMNILFDDRSTNSQFQAWLAGIMILGCSVIGGISLAVPLRAMNWITSRLQLGTGLSISYLVALTLNVCTLFIYYGWKYTAQGTSIPEWTRWLG